VRISACLSGTLKLTKENASMVHDGNAGTDKPETNNHQIISLSHEDHLVRIWKDGDKGGWTDAPNSSLSPPTTLSERLQRLIFLVR
jgi:hypothetical protein